MTIIKSPNGQAAEVDSENRLLTFAVTEPEDKHINTEGGVSSIFFTVTPAGANDYFFYLKNTGLKDLLVSDFRISSSVPTTVFYERVSGTPTFVTGTAAQVTNRNLGNPVTASGDAIFDTDITGLTSEGVLFFEECINADTRYSLRTTSHVIIPQGQAMAFRKEAATGTITAVISLIVAE